MGKLKSFEIVFENPQGVFFTGQVMSGTVCLELTEPLTMRELRLTCLGRAFVHWSEVENVGHRGGRQRIETVEHTDTEDYFQYRFSLWKGGVSDDKGSLPAGDHAFPFTFTLPPGLPSSFEGDYGYVRYWAKATIDRPWKFDIYAKRAFSVIASLDLSLEPMAPESLHYHGEISAGCCCLPSGRFSGRFCTNYRGFVPGMDLMLYSEVENHTSSSCWAEVKLKLHVTYVAGRKYVKQEKKVICRAQLDEIERGKCSTWTEALQIPPLPPSRLSGCKLINTQYFLQFIVRSDASCSCDDIEFEDEVIIGTIPLAPALPTSLSFSLPPPEYPHGPVVKTRKKKDRKRSQENEAILDVLEGKKRSAEGSVTGPPSYEECMFGEVSIRDKDDSENTSGKLTFTPRYSFYKNIRKAQSSKPKS